MLAENPVSDLPHYRLFIVFHLRSLQFLDGQPISEQEREKAHQRFHSGILLLLLTVGIEALIRAAGSLKSEVEKLLLLF